MFGSFGSGVDDDWMPLKIVASEARRDTAHDAPDAADHRGSDPNRSIGDPWASFARTRSR